MPPRRRSRRWSRSRRRSRLLFAGAPSGRDRGGHAGLRTLLRRSSELAPDVVRGLPALVGILGEARPDDPVERGRRHRLGGGDRRRLARHDRRDERRSARAGERLLPGRHLVEHVSEREDVGPRVGGLSLELLGRHVLEGAEDRAPLRERAIFFGREGRDVFLVRLPADRLREAEIEQLDAARDHMMFPGLRSRWTSAGGARSRARRRSAAEFRGPVLAEARRARAGPKAFVPRAAP